MVLGHQHPELALDATDHRDRLFLDRGLGLGQVQVDGEHRAHTQLAADLDVTAHHAGQVARDLQSQPGAADAAAQRVVGLVEPGEQPGDRFLVHAHASVAHGEHHTGLARGRTGQLGDHAAFAGELDGVVDQVEHDLAQARGVGLHPAGQVGRSVDVQLQPLVAGGHLHQAVDLVHHAGQVDRHHRELERARLHGRDVQDVVEHAQQVHRGIARGAQVVALLVGQRGVVQQVEHAQQALERGADLVAHVGQEDALAVVGGLGLVAGLGQFVTELLQPGVLALLLADVLHQQADEDQHHRDLRRRQADHQQALVAQLGVAFVDETGHGAVGLAREFAHQRLEVLDGAVQQGQLPGAGRQRLRIGEQRVGDLVEVLDPGHGCGVFEGGFEQVAARYPGQQVDAAEVDLVALKELVAVDRAGRLEGVHDRVFEPAQLAFELVGLPHDRVDLVGRHIVEHAVLAPLDPAQWRQGDGQQQRDGQDPLPTLPAGQIWQRECHWMSRALSCQMDRS